MEDFDNFNYGDDAFMFDQEEMKDHSFHEATQPSISKKTSPKKLQRFSFGTSELGRSFTSPTKKDISVIDLVDSPVFAKRPPSINLDDPTTFSKPKETKLNIPENVPFSELNDEVRFIELMFPSSSYLSFGKTQILTFTFKIFI